MSFENIYVINIFNVWLLLTKRQCTFVFRFSCEYKFFLRHIPKSAVSVTHGKSIVKRNFFTVFSSAVSFYVLSSKNSGCPSIVLNITSIFIFATIVKVCFIVVFVCDCLIAYEAEHLFILLFDTDVSSLIKDLFKSFNISK